MRRILNISLLILITVIMIFLGIINYFQLKAQNERLFNIQMVHAARLVDVLVSMNVQHASLNELAKLLKAKPQNLISESQIRQQLKPKTEEFINIYRQAFSFQVYNLSDDHILVKSSNAPDKPMNVPVGFSELACQQANCSNWYVFAIDSQYQPVKIVIAVNLGFKETVLMDLFWTSLRDLIWLYIIAAIVVMIVVRVIFAPLAKITIQLKKRDPKNLEPIKIEHAPKEVAPLLNQLNQLFIRIDQTLKREQRFAGDAAHELKTPLAGLKMQIEVALNIDDINQIKEKIKQAIKSADRFYHIIDQLLTLTRLEPKEDLKTKEKIELNRLAATWVAEMAPVAIEKNIELSLERFAQKLWLFASPVTLDILFRNLIDNAIRYTPEGGKVNVELNKKNHQVILKFSDNGIGVEKEKLLRIFDRFYRQSGTGADGSGLGLSIVKEIVRLHNGVIHAYKNNPNGLVVEIILPSYDDDV